MSSPLAAAATGKREAEKTLRRLKMAYCANSIARFLKRYCNSKTKGFVERRIQTLLEANELAGSPWTPEESGLMMLQAIHKVFGDPQVLKKIETIPYHVKYYNPTEIHINISSMGLKASDGSTMHALAPGGLISIPYSYTQGNKYSVVSCIAPQLKPLPITEHDIFLDLTPTSYDEWIFYQSYQPSECCKRQVLWSEKNQVLFCEKCNKEIRL